MGKVAQYLIVLNPVCSFLFLYVTWNGAPWIFFKIGPLFFCLFDILCFCSDGIKMYLPAQDHQIGVLFYENRLESPLKQMSASSVSFIKSYGVGQSKVPHKPAEVCLGRFYYHMVMIIHENIGFNFHSGSFGAVFQGVNEQDPIRIVLEDEVPFISSAHDMV